jgi:hypothetical protein
MWRREFIGALAGAAVTRSLGIEFPTGLLVCADEVIE